MDSLKPCPFCGGEAETWSHYFEEEDMTLWQVRCKERPYDVEHPCYTADSFISFTTEAEAIEAWNTRAERTCRIKDTDLPKTSPLLSIPRIRVYDKDGRLVADGYYAFHQNRQLCVIGDKLKPEDCDHCVVIDGFADWNMPMAIEVKKIVPDGGWIEVVNDAD